MIAPLLAAVLAVPAAADPGLSSAFETARAAFSRGAPSTVPQAVGRKVSHQEQELARCPRDAAPLPGRPDPRLYTYIGFRLVRDDGSTCAAAPSGRTLYQEPRSQRLAYQADPAGDPPSYDYDLATRQYQVRREYFLRTHLDGSRRIYQHEGRVYTGAQVPETVRVEFLNRDAYPLLPWEEGDVLTLEYGHPDGAKLAVGSSIYEYQVQSSVGRAPDGRLQTTFRLIPLRKRELRAPDASGLALELSVVNRGGRNHQLIRVVDKWPRYYRGARTGLKVEVWRDRAGFGDDKQIFDIAIEVEPSGELVIDLGDPRWEPFRRAPHTRSRDYYVKWQFRRVGSGLSTDAWLDKGATGKVHFPEDGTDPGQPGGGAPSPYPDQPPGGY